MERATATRRALEALDGPADVPPHDQDRDQPERNRDDCRQVVREIRDNRRQRGRDLGSEIHSTYPTIRATDLWTPRHVPPT